MNSACVPSPLGKLEILHCHSSPLVLSAPLWSSVLPSGPQCSPLVLSAPIQSLVLLSLALSAPFWSSVLPSGTECSRLVLSVPTPTSHLFLHPSELFIRPLVFSCLNSLNAHGSHWLSAPLPRFVWFGAVFSVHHFTLKA